MGGPKYAYRNVPAFSSTPSSHDSENVPFLPPIPRQEIVRPPTPQDSLRPPNIDATQLEQAANNTTHCDDEDSQATVLSDDDDIALMFLPSQQPLASQKFIDCAPHLPVFNEVAVPTFTSEITVLYTNEQPDLDIEDENLFMPLSFQEYGY